MPELISMREKVLNEALTDLGKENPDVVVLDADLAIAIKCSAFAAEFPDRSFQIGIAEQNMAGVAAGMATAGSISLIWDFRLFCQLPDCGSSAHSDRSARPEREDINVVLDERALREIYLPAFKAAVQDGGVWCVMGAYNQLRGQHCCENNYLLNVILKGQWGFKGLVMTDWGGAHDTRECALNGLDLEMGSGRRFDNYYFAQPYLAMLKSGELPISGLDEKVRRNLRVMFATHVFDAGRTNGSQNTVAHQLVARRVAEEGIVLLKNTTTPCPSTRRKLPALRSSDKMPPCCRRTAATAQASRPSMKSPPGKASSAAPVPTSNITYSEGYRKNGGPELAERAVLAAKSADVVIYIGGLNHDRLRHRGLGPQRHEIALRPGRTADPKLVAANPHTIVVLDGTIMEMGPWLDQAPAVLQAWYPAWKAATPWRACCSAT